MRSFLFGLILLTGCASAPRRQPSSELRQNPLITQHVYNVEIGLELRTALYLESEKVPFQGCVLYLQGLSDSLANHKPLYEALSQKGFRVVSFDYMGQGDSEGSMNDTRLESIKKNTEIGEQAKWVWDLYSRAEMFTYRNKNCQGSKKRVMGWSTGGLATYKLAHEKWAESVVLIAPGIHPKMLVGESAKDWKKMVFLQEVISESSLTRNTFRNSYNPHEDPIKPDSPMKVPLFATNLMKTSLKSRHWKISSKTKGLVLLSGKEDTYVDSPATVKTLKKNAPHFGTKSYPGALHELDNELPKVAEDVREMIIEHFLEY